MSLGAPNVLLCRAREFSLPKRTIHLNPGPLASSGRRQSPAASLNFQCPPHRRIIPGIHMSADTHGGTHFFAQIQTRSIVRAILADFARWNVKILLNSARLHRRKRGDPTPHQTRIFTLFRTLFQRIQRSKRGWHETPPLTIKGETPDTISGTSLPA